MGDIEKVDVDFNKLVQTLLDHNKKPRRSGNKEERVKSWEGSLETLPDDKAELLATLMDSFLEEKFGKVLVEDEPRRLTDEELVALSNELESARTLSEVMTAVNNRARRLIFEHIEETRYDSDDPELENEEILVPETGKKFSRYGAGYDEASVDLSKLDKVLNPEQFNAVVTTTYSVSGLSKRDTELIMNALGKHPVEAHHEYDMKALAKIITSDGEVERKIRPYIKPGKRKSGSFGFKDIKGDEE